MGTSDEREDPYTGATGYVFGYRSDRGPLMSAIGVVFFTVWGGQFLSDLTAMTTSLSVSGWFFTRDKTKSVVDVECLFSQGGFNH